MGFSYFFKLLSFATLTFYLAVISDIFSTTEALVQLPPNRIIPAVIAFGDSFVDSGNNNHLNTTTMANSPPYGRDFKGGIPTGRFCNGKLSSDFIAGELGIREIVPAYLDPKLQPNDLITGVSFASGGTGYDPLTPKLTSAISLSQQLDFFKEYIGKLKATVGEDRTNFILANSMFLAVAGSVDIAVTYFDERARIQYDVPAYTDLMINEASNFLKDLYTLGARRVGVYNVPPIGCLPSQRTLAGGILRECVKEYNEAAQLFNSKLSRELDSLNANLPGSKMVYWDVYNPFLDIIQNPEKYDFKVSNRGCCGTGTIEVAIWCNAITPVTCPSTSSYVFWDSFHGTERTYKILVSELLPKYLKRFFD